MTVMKFVHKTIIFSALVSQIFLSCSLKPITEEKLDQPILYTTACQIFDSDFKFIRAISSDFYCLLLPDGGWVSSNDSTLLRRWNADGDLLWERHGYYHHQLSKLDDTYFLALSAETHDVKKHKVIFQLVQKISLLDGKIVSEYSVFKELYKTKSLKGSGLDRPPVANFQLEGKLRAPLEQDHFNSIMSKDGQIFVNDLEKQTLILDLDLKFQGFFKYPPTFDRFVSNVTHDFQSIGSGRYLFFKNFNRFHTTTKKTFRIFEIENNAVVFKFPNNEADFVQSDYSGGVEKIGNDYLVGFPTEPIQGQSFVGLISGEGYWIKKAMLPFRIQDIKRVPYSDYLKLNKVK